MSGRYRGAFIAGGVGGFPSPVATVPVHAVVGASASRVPEPAPERGGRPGNKTAARVTAGCVETPHSNPGGHRPCPERSKGSTEKNFVGMTLAPLRAAVFRSGSAFRRSR